MAMIVYVLSTVVASALGAHLVSQVVEPPLVATVRLHTLGFIGLLIYLYRQHDSSLIRSVGVTLLSGFIYTLALAASIGIYRLYFHRLRKYPGDTLNKLTNYSWIADDWNGRRAFRLQALHARYGPVVRIGPREVSIAKADALKVILGASGKLLKEGPRHSALIFAQSPMGMENQRLLKRGRRRRQQAIKMISIDLDKRYPTLQNLVDRCISQIREQSSETEGIDIMEHIDRLAFDAAMMLAVGQHLGTLDKDHLPETLVPIEEQIRMLNTLACVPYCIEAVRLIPSTTKEFDRWIKNTLEQQDTITSNLTFADHLLIGEKQTPNNAVWTAEVRSFILQTCAAVRSILTFCLYELLCETRFLIRLQKEILQVSSSTASLYGLPFLDACLDETLRLWPPLPCAIQKITPIKRLEVNKKLTLPGNVILSIPSFVIQRDSHYFSSPNQFDPTRWLPKETTATKHNIAAFCPFGFESTGSVSKSLVLLQSRMVLVELLRNFNIESASHLSAASIRHAYHCQYTIAKAECSVFISKR